jgi:hypothetical protein
MLKEKINADFIAAMKNKDVVKKNLLTVIRGEIQTMEKNNGIENLSDDDVTINYNSTTYHNSETQSTKIDNDKFIKLLASSIGYGYYYVRETKPGEVKVVPILSAEDAYSAIGKITNVEVKYPGPTTKILALKIDTDSPTFGPSQYLVAIRNTQGKLLPLSLRISKTK